MSTSWAPADIETLRTLAAQELSAAEIGNRLGRTRNMIIGRARRSGIPLLHTQFNALHLKPWNAKRREAERLRIAEKRLIAKVSPRVLHDTKLRAAAAEPVQVPSPPPATRVHAGFTILQLRDGMCKSPVRFLDRRECYECAAIIDERVHIDQRMCCGGPIPKDSQFEFCEAHQERFLSPNTLRMRAA